MTRRYLPRPASFVAPATSQGLPTNMWGRPSAATSARRSQGLAGEYLDAVAATTSSRDREITVSLRSGSSLRARTWTTPAMSSCSRTKAARALTTPPLEPRWRSSGSVAWPSQTSSTGPQATSS